MELPVRRLADGAELHRVLSNLGLAPGRIVDLVTSPYALQSPPVHVDRRAAARTGLITTGPVERAFTRLATAVADPTQPVRCMVPGPAPRRPSRP